MFSDANHVYIKRMDLLEGRNLEKHYHLKFEKEKLRVIIKPNITQNRKIKHFSNRYLWR